MVFSGGEVKSVLPALANHQMTTSVTGNARNSTVRRSTSTI